MEAASMSNKKIFDTQNRIEKEYWFSKFTEDIGLINFPCKAIQEINNEIEKAISNFEFSLSINSRLNKLCNGSFYRLSMVLNTVVSVLLNKYTNENNIFIGNSIFKQKHSDNLVNTILPIRLKISKHDTFKSLLLKMREEISESVKYQDYPMDLLLEQINLVEKNGVFPLFDVVVLLDNIHSKDYIKHTNPNILFLFNQDNEKIRCKIEYNSISYSKEFIDRLVAQLSTIIELMLDNIDLKITDISFISESEKEHLLIKLNETKGNYIISKPVYKLFEESVLSNPDNVALVFENNALTYGELNKRSNLFANYLKNKGVKNSDIVALMLDSSLELIEAILGVIKSGAAYLPISLNTPHNRLLSILNDSNVKILVTSNSLLEDHSFFDLSINSSEQILPYITKSRKQELNLDNFQIPDRSYIDYEKYTQHIGQSMVKNSISLQLSRGCSFKCAYCFKIWKDKYVVRSAENFFNELYMYYKMGFRRFGFIDDLPNFNIEISSEIYRLIIKNGLKVHLHFPNGIRGDILTKEYIDLMVEAGAITMDLALETSSKRLQKLIRKNINLPRLEENMRYIAEKYPHVILETQILHGLPSETEKEAGDTLEFLKDISWVHFPYIHILKIYPNTEMAKIAIEHGVSMESIEESADLAYHDLPETLPFEKQFTRKYQSQFLSEYFLNKERLLKVLPYQMKVLTEDELVQKYDSYLPITVKNFDFLLEYIGIQRNELGDAQFLPYDYGFVKDLNSKISEAFPREELSKDPYRVLLLDLSQYFTSETELIYDVIEPPLGLMYLMTNLKKEFGNDVDGRILKSRIDFDSYEELYNIVSEYKPDFIGIRSLNFFKDFFHKSISYLRGRNVTIPIVTGGPYATSCWDSILSDSNIDMAIIGEGEATLNELVRAIISNNKEIPSDDILKNIDGLAFIEEGVKIKNSLLKREVILYDNSLIDIVSEESIDIKQHSSLDDLAYVIYTSGSTGIPKGVLIDHHNLSNQIMGLINKYDINEQLNYLLLTDYAFDVSIMHIFTSLATKGKLYILSDKTKLDTLKLWDVIHDSKIDILNTVPEFMKVLLSDGQQKRESKFSYIFIGGDSFDLELYKQLKNKFPEDKIINIYGPTETTINATTFECSDISYDSIGDILPIGKPLMNYKTYILDNNMSMVPFGGVGELYISGDGVSRGYLNNVILTSEKFVNSSCVEGELLYKTGDLARYLDDGNIEFLGRVDNQVKIRGNRIELGEVERNIKKLASVNNAVVKVISKNGQDKALCAYIVLDRTNNREESEFDESKIRDDLSKFLLSYMIPSYFVELEEIPLTVTGKIDRKALPDPETSVGCKYVAPRNIIEEKMVIIWSDVLGVDHKKIGIDDSFFNLGGHSLKSTILISRIQKEFNVKISVEDFFNNNTVRLLMSKVDLSENVKFISISKAGEKPYYPLSSAQKRLYLLQQFDPLSIAYNMPIIIPLGIEFNKSKIEECFQKLIIRHDSFRTSFNEVEQEPAQFINKEVEFKIEEYTIEKKDKQKFSNEFVKPFKLSQAPVLRVAIVEIKEEGSLLLIDMHHIISDGVSQIILEREYQALYAGEELPALKLQYKDYSEWQNSKEQQEEVKEQEDYWVRKFEGEIPILNLRNDYPRPLIQSQEGASVSFVLDIEETKIIKSLTQENGLTLYMSVLSVFSILLAKLSGDQDIIVGAPIACRSHSDLENIVGMFVNMLAMRNEVDRRSTLKEFVGKLKQNTLEAYENQDYQFENLVEKVSVERDTSRNPIFDVMFNLLNQTEYSDDLSGLLIDEYVHTSGISKFDLTLTAVDYGEQLLLSFEYCTKLFKAETIDRFIVYFKQIVSQLARTSEIKISEIDILTEEEKNQLLYEFNNTKADYPKDKRIHQLFEEQVAKTPDNIALVIGAKSITYSELNKKSNQLARYLKGKGLDVNDKIGLMVDRSIDVVLGILGILKVGGAYLPIDSTYPEPRINYIISNSDSKIILTQNAHVEKIVGKLPIAVLEDLDLYKEEASNLNTKIKSNNLSYIIYTSGSTGNPKGVQVEHSSVVNLLYFLQEIYPLNENDSYLLKTSYCFDVSVSELFGWILGGGKLSILEKDHEKDPVKMIEAINKFEITHINFVPTVFKSFSHSIFTLEKNKLRSLKYILIAGETLLKEHLHEFNDLNLKAQIANLYGPTEATVYTSHYRLSSDEFGAIFIGKPVSNYEVYIVDRNNQIQPTGVSGELLVGGEGLARGYLCNEELTSEKFIENPYKSGERLYKTGDLARWLPDGNIEFMGRIDNQVKIRGFRIELGEIESTLLKHENIKENVVLAIEKNNEKYLCAYIVCKEEHNHEELKSYMSSQLPDYMVPSYFVELESLPLNVNGKVNRKVLPSPEVKAGDDYVAPSNDLEEKLVKIWSEVLNIDKEDISVNANFFSIGGHSLKATVLTSKIHKEIGVEFPLREVFLHSTIKSQASQIEKSTKKNFVSIPKAKEQSNYPLSSAQKRLYLLQQFDLTSTVYNMPYIIPLGKELDKSKIEEVFKQLINRHESFRTSIIIVDQEPVQLISKNVAFKLEEIIIENTEIENIRNKFIKPFDLSQAPFLRVAIVDIKGEESLLMIDMHHIISDGTSHIILEKEYQALLSGEELAPLPLQYKDYSEWQNSKEQQEHIKNQEQYWLNKFEGEIPVLNLPTDYVRPLVQSHEGATVKFVLSKKETEGIKIFTKENDLTLYMSLLSVFSILLSKLSGQDDIVVGTPIAGRNHADLESIVGMFVNTLSIRNEVKGEETIQEFVSSLKQTVLGAYENQNYQFEDLVDKVSVARDTSRNPIFDVVINLLNQAEHSGDISGIDNENLIHTKGVSKFDLSLSVVDFGEQLLISFNYCTQLFKAETIDRFIVYFKQIVSQLARKAEIKISAIDILTESEKYQLLYEFNDTKRDYPKDKTIHQLFEEQVERTPDNIAIVFNDTEITYQELDQRSNQLSHLLVSTGIKPDDVVVIMLDRSIEMIVGILSVLKSGGAYCPIDVNNPIERKKYIIEDSKTKLLLSRTGLLEVLSFEGEKIDIDNFTIVPGTDKSVGQKNTAEDLAYVIYTSGTTGNPKGIMIQHDGVVNTISWYANRYKLTSGVRLLQLSNYSFDASVNQIFGTLNSGATLHVVSEDILHDFNSLYSYLESHHINVINSVPVVLEDLISNREKLPLLERIISGGEKLSNKLKEKIRGLGYKLHNHYGPTEGTIVVLAEECSDKNVTLGKPKQNTQSYILSESINQLQVIGAKGELCISGVGIARGYLNNDELTLEKFIAHPFRKGERLYRTGDLVRRLPNGNIEFLGRIDHQVKIRGFRIELEEIESTLLKYNSIKESVVLAREENGDKYLCAYVVCEDEFNQEEIRAYLLAYLPDYMIPSYFVELEEFPLASNGKLNRKALPCPKIKAGDDYVSPLNETEETLVKIWAEVLNIEKEVISVNSNFFEIGGNSIKIISLNQKINNRFNINIEVAEMFRLTTIRLLAVKINNKEMDDITTDISDNNIEKTVEIMDEYLTFMEREENE